MKIRIPKGSIMQLPKKNTDNTLFVVTSDIVVDSEDIEIIKEVICGNKPE